MPETKNAADSAINLDTTSFPPLKNDLYLRAARGEKTERAPVWCMRQAGRYLPEFRAIRVEHDFFNVCRTPALATEVTVQPLRRYADLLDAAIIFSDILVVPQAMGLEVQMVPGKGPHFPSPLETPGDMERLTDKDSAFSVDQELGYVYKAITNTRHALDGQVPLLGFVGAPWTLMAYMVEGGGSKTFARAKEWLFRHRSAAHELLGRVADVAAQFLVGQIDAGAQAAQVFESWAGELSPRDFAEFSLPYLARIAAHVKAKHPDVPLTVFAKGAHYALESLVAETVYDVISLDWTIDPTVARARVDAAAAATTPASTGAQNIRRRPVVLQGNLDPTLLFADPQTICERTDEMCKAFGSSLHIANLGHGMMPGHDPEHLRVFLKAVHSSSSALRRQ
ncbi:Uroporphyrinogen decarboxylase in heme biosynthesis [Coemansia sp. RSA 1285]|nr:Uroporphyrinogen decarboxylase in heme biosynthesis [Coemansia sp. RSA 1804]KAJ2683820.1 Uroporphyrinogen decarboxylase in heme biosynthesis [Coemansia sp. RSA 1285]